MNKNNDKMNTKYDESDVEMLKKAVKVAKETKDKK